jgi:hypothetical protein
MHALVILIILLIIAYYYRVTLIGPLNKYSSAYISKPPLLAWYTNNNSYAPHIIKVMPGNVTGMTYYKSNNDFDTLYMLL